MGEQPEGLTLSNRIQFAITITAHPSWSSGRWTIGMHKNSKRHHSEEEPTGTWDSSPIHSGYHARMHIVRESLGTNLVGQAKDAVIYCFNYYTQALLHNHLMGDLWVCFACRQDPRLFLVTAREEHTGTQISMCYALWTLSKKRNHGEASVSIYLCKCNAMSTYSFYLMIILCCTSYSYHSPCTHRRYAEC